MLSAGYARIRPVLMTAAAMMLGMLPMALGLGEGGEQNAPLGRAVIGGLLGATVTTLFIVPIIYSYLRTKPPGQSGAASARRKRRGRGAGHELRHANDEDHVIRGGQATVTEQELRRQVDELTRQLNDARRRFARVPPANLWQPSRTTISALLFGILVLLVIAFVAGYLPLQQREASAARRSGARRKRACRGWR